VCQKNYTQRTGLGDVRDISIPSAWLNEVEKYSNVKVINFCSIAFGQGGAKAKLKKKDEEHGL